MMMKMIPALLFAAALVLTGCDKGDDHGHSHSSTGTEAHDHDGKGHEHGHEHEHGGENAKEIGKLNLLGQEFTVFQVGEASEGMLSDYDIEVGDKKGLVFRAWYGDANGKLIGPKSEPSHGHDGGRLGIHPRLPKDAAKDIKLWIELEADGKTEKGSVSFKRK